MSTPRRPASFASASAFRAWLARHHAAEKELIVRCYKVHAADRGLTNAQAVDEALCFGWIDGVRRSLDDDSFSVRFSPRRPGSVWSSINIRRAGELEAEGRMKPAGLAAFRARTARSAERYSYESEIKEMDAPYLRKFRARPRAWAFYASRPPGYRRLTAFWVMSAKREETRLRRLEILITSSERGKPIPGLERTPKPRKKAAPKSRG